MNYAKSIVLSILSEGMYRDNIVDAIKKRYAVTINYGNPNEIGGGTRKIYPLVYGSLPNGNYALHAFQPNGDTKTRVPNYKLFSVEKITKWVPNYDEIFQKPNGYNETQDRLFSEIYIMANFGEASQPLQKGGQNNMPKSGNRSSSDEMKSINTDVKDAQSVGPITKDMTDSSGSNDSYNLTGKDSDNIEMNGPQFK